MGRPSKLNPDLQGRIVNALRAGAYLDEAARSCGLAPSTFHAWRARGNAELDQLASHEGRVTRAEQKRRALEQPFVDFVLAVDEALAAAEIHAVAIVRGAMKDDWRSAAWYLERRHPDRWRRRTTHEVEQGDPDKPLAVEVEVGEKVVTDAAHAFLKQLAAAGQE